MGNISNSQNPSGESGGFLSLFKFFHKKHILHQNLRLTIYNYLDTPQLYRSIALLSKSERQLLSSELSFGLIDYPRCLTLRLDKYSLPERPLPGVFPEYLIGFHDSITIILDKYQQEHSTKVMSMLQNSLDKCRNSEGGKKRMKIRVDINAPQRCFKKIVQQIAIILQYDKFSVDIMNSCFHFNDNLIEQLMQILTSDKAEIIPTHLTIEGQEQDRFQYAVKVPNLNIQGFRFKELGIIKIIKGIQYE